MKDATKENAARDYLENVVFNAWTWERLTQEEKARFVDLIESTNAKGTVKQRRAFVCELYRAFLAGLNYKPIGWREPITDENPLF